MVYAGDAGGIGEEASKNMSTYLPTSVDGTGWIKVVLSRSKLMVVSREAKESRACDCHVLFT